MTVVEASARMLMRVLVAIFTAAVLALFGSAFSTAAVTPHLRLILGAIAIAAYFRPSHSLVVLAAVLPLSGAFLSGISPGTRNAEALILAFLSGALIRGWTLHRFRGFPSDRLHAAALVFALIVAASCAEQLWFTQLQRDFPSVFLRDLFIYITNHYLSSFRGLGTLFQAMLLIEGVGLLLYAAHYGRTVPSFMYRLGAALLAGAVGAAALNVGFFAHELIETGQPRERFVEFFLTERWSAHVGDANAAGAFFCMALFAAAAAAVVDRRTARYTLPIAAFMALVMWLTGSRTAVAIASVMAVVCSVIAARWLRFSPKAIAAAALILVVGGLVGAAGISRVVANLEAVDAVRIRGVFLGVTGRMLQSQPLFGMGVGQYSQWSRNYMPPDLQNTYYARENAHNNFAQIAGELGLIGITAFLWMLASALVITAVVRRSHAAIVWPALAGLLAFIATWVGNHPLLVPAVAYPFWLALGIAGALAAPTSSRFAAPAAAAGALALALSLPWRVDRKLTLIDPTHVTYGLTGARVMAERARFFVPDGTARVVLPLRARSVPDQPLAIDIAIDEAHTVTVHLSNDRWTEWTLDIPGKTGRRAHQIDLHLRDPAEATGAAPQGHRIDVGEWSIIPKPHG